MNVQTISICNESSSLLSNAKSDPSCEAPSYAENAPLGETTRPRPFEAPRYTVSMISMSWAKWSVHFRHSLSANMLLPPVCYPLPSYLRFRYEVLETHRQEWRHLNSHLVVVTGTKIYHYMLVSGIVSMRKTS